MNEEELHEVMIENDDFMYKGIVQGDVADILERGHTHEELIAEIKEYFDLDDEYYEERAMMNGIVQKAIAAEKSEKN